MGTCRAEDYKFQNRSLHALDFASLSYNYVSCPSRNCAVFFGTAKKRERNQRQCGDVEETVMGSGIGELSTIRFANEEARAAARQP